MAKRVARTQLGAQRLLLVSTMALMTSGCSRPVEWTNEDRNNARHVILAFEALSKSVQEENALGAGFKQEELDKVLFYLGHKLIN